MNAHPCQPYTANHKAQEKDLLGDGSIRKQQISAGDGGKWLNEVPGEGGGVRG